MMWFQYFFFQYYMLINHGFYASVSRDQAQTCREVNHLPDPVQQSFNSLYYYSIVQKREAGARCLFKSAILSILIISNSTPNLLELSGLAL